MTTAAPERKAARVTQAPPNLARYRKNIAVRTVAATLGAYALAAGCAHWLALLLPLPRIDAVMAASMLALLIYSIAAMWCFRAPSVVRVCAYIAIPAGLLWALAHTFS